MRCCVCVCVKQKHIFLSIYISHDEGINKEIQIGMLFLLLKHLTHQDQDIH